MNIVACLMLKEPRPGRVKTRLARDVGASEATAIYRSLVEAQLARIPAKLAVAIAVEPPEAISAMRVWLGERPSCFGQAAGDLGARLAAATDHLFATGADRVLLLGGDCPALDAARLAEAVAALDAADVCVIPALDGGYCLIGLRGPHIGMFADIAWSTETVFRETVARAATLGLTLRVLGPALEDVDDLASWRRALASGTMQNPPATAST